MVNVYPAHSVRRVTIEFAVADVATMMKVPQIEKIESLEVLSFLKVTPDEVTLVCRIRLRDSATKIEDVFGGKLEDLQILEREGGSAICFLSARCTPGDQELIPLDAGGYLSVPYEIKEGRVRTTFLGNAKEVRGVIQRIEETGVPYKVLSIMDARFSPGSPLASLTEKQRRVILSAFTDGYYDVPRRVSSEDLARRLNLREPTLVMHRRKAERRLLAALIGES
jgi:hypothetical protein